ncbi:unnamed protein product [Lupinus luteus]|uniref:Uncharacterized protein n=1 Tax=Lupinus luteus TaxID=3873 RepID=A0AAV1Y685_LUPLU
MPNLDSSDSTASVSSMQVTLFSKSGFSIGITAHHAVLDGKSSTMFIKAWANMCRSSVEESHSFSLKPKLEPFLDRDVIKDPTQLDLLLADNWTKDPNDATKKKRSLEILSFLFKPKVENSVNVRAKMDAKPEDFTKEDGFVIVAKKILSKTKSLDKDGSSRFGVYENDFGWEKPSKVEITFVDRGLSIGISESKDEKGGL